MGWTSTAAVVGAVAGAGLAVALFSVTAPDLEPAPASPPTRTSAGVPVTQRPEPAPVVVEVTPSASALPCPSRSTLVDGVCVVRRVHGVRPTAGG